MDLSNTLVSPSNREDPEDALRVLGRVADAFDSPSLHKADKELLFVVNVAKPRRLLPCLSSEESVFQDTAYGSSDSSFDTSYDEDVEVMELGDVGIWEHTTSYPYVSRRSQLQQPRSFSDMGFREDDRVYDVTKMLLTSSPLDRLDRLARLELKKSGWVERTDKWSVVEMGLKKEPLPQTPPKTPRKVACFHQQRSSSPSRSAKTTPPKSEKRSPLSTRAPTGGEQSASKRECAYTPERNQHQGSAIKSDTMRSRTHSQGSDSYMDDFSPLFSNVSGISHASPVTPNCASRFSRRAVGLSTQPQTGGRLGQVVRNFVKKMLPAPSPNGSHSRPRAGQTTRTCQGEMTPRSDVSGESEWTFASAGGQGCLEYQASGRWSGFWH